MKCNLNFGLCIIKGLGQRLKFGLKSTAGGAILD